MKNTSKLISKRKEFTDNHLKVLSSSLNDLPEVERLPDLCIYATGSYARYEASKFSDIDLFFVHKGNGEKSKVSRIDELRLFARVIDIGQKLNFPAFSNDGEFLKILYLDDMLEMLGGREDDFHNFFTARMLLLLESTPLVNTDLFDNMIISIIEAYYRDYPDHVKNFRPVFLINDIIRFWKTLCLNYEHRRNKPKGDKLQKRRQQIKNFKLKFSRLMTCFGTVVAICAMGSPIRKHSIIELTKMSPLDRFLKATDGIDEFNVQKNEILSDYEWFMKYTGLETEELLELFDRKGEKEKLFKRADEFGNSVYSVLEKFADRNKYRRYLVI